MAALPDMLAALRDQPLSEASRPAVVQAGPHAIRVEHLGGGTYLARCACGWAGLPTAAGAHETCPLAPVKGV